MLDDIGSIENVPAFIDEVKSGKGSRLMGFGHRVYKNYDPRATIVKKTAYDVFEVTGKNPLLDIALKLEETALSDPYFVDRKLYPNVDFYSGLIYQALGFPVAMFTVLFAIPRTVGWLAHWQELLGGRVDATMSSSLETAFLTREHPDLVAILTAEPRNPIPLAFMSPLNDTVFKNFLDSWVQIRLASGFFAELNAKWGLV
jgi:hypothetical protein